jgi:SNF2 family DNA or RNA helicase
MAGLLIKELKLRGLAERILIVCPANLTFQWQRELNEKFGETFVVLKGATLRDQFGINHWGCTSSRDASGRTARR